MSKRPSLGGLVKPPTTHSNASMQSHNDATMQLRDDEVPDAMPVPAPKVKAETVPETPTVELEPKAIQESSRKTRKAKGKPVEDETTGMAHRSLYARPETLELIRRIAFEERISAQSIYREGLLLALQKRGHMKGKSLDDV